MNAIQVETDPQNTHMLLGGLMLCVQDSALFEECADFSVDTRQTSPAPSDTNLLSSGMNKYPIFNRSSFFSSFLQMINFNTYSVRQKKHFLSFFKCNCFVQILTNHYRPITMPISDV